MELPIKRCPIKYETNKSVHEKARSEEIEQLIMKLNLKNELNFMEYGCNTGSICFKHLGPLAEKMNLTIYAVDSSESMIEYAKENYPHPRINYIHGDVTYNNMPFSHLKFNQIFSSYYLQSLNVDFWQELQAMYELLAPKGEIFVSAWHNPMLFEISSYIKHEEWKAYAKDHVSEMKWVKDFINDPEASKKRILDLGFTVNELQIFQMTYTFEKLAILTDVMLSHNSFVHHLSEVKVNELRAIYNKHILETPTKTYTPDPDGENKPYVYEYDVVRIYLTK